MRETKAKDKDATSNKMTVVCAYELVPVIAQFSFRGGREFIWDSRL